MLKRTEPGTAEMAQWVGVFTTKPDDLSSIPGWKKRIDCRKLPSTRMAHIYIQSQYNKKIKTTS